MATTKKMQARARARKQGGAARLGGNKSFYALPLWPHTRTGQLKPCEFMAQRGIRNALITGDSVLHVNGRAQEVHVALFVTEDFTAEEANSLLLSIWEDELHADKQRHVSWIPLNNLDEPLGMSTFDTQEVRMNVDDMVFMIAGFEVLS